MGLLNTLNQQLAEALITLDLLRETTRADDPRIAQAERRIEVIEARIAEERRKFGVGDASSDTGDYASVMAEFERLSVDREFAERAYIAALSAFDGARAEAQRQSRYLAAYVRPTLAETAEYPGRILLTGLVGLFLLLAWAILALVYYSLRDRR
jgi:capsular polysaccharide transport system permease protein